MYVSLIFYLDPEDLTSENLMGIRKEGKISL